MRKHLTGKKCREVVGGNRPWRVGKTYEDIFGLDAKPIGQRRLDTAADRIARSNRVEPARLKNASAVDEREIGLELCQRETAGRVKQPMIGRHVADAWPHRRQPIGLSIGGDGELAGHFRIVNGTAAGRAIEVGPLHVGFDAEQEIADLPVVSALDSSNEAGGVDGLGAGRVDGG